MLDEKNWSAGVRKMRDFYAIKPNAGIHQQEFGFYAMDRWKKEGHLSEDVTQAELNELFGFDQPGLFNLGGLGWCEGGFIPTFDEKWIRDEGDAYEIVQDFAGRHVKYFKGRRQGFMPEYVDHPVKDMKTWEELCKWRLDPKTPERQPQIAKTVARAKQAELEGKVICQNLVGGYMYLRSLMGPLELMYLLYDEPELIHDCMQTWFNLADAVIAQHQEHVTLDDIYIGEDICYNHGLLISKDMVREFLFPYYQQLLTNARKRQLDPTRKIFFHLDTDGFSDEALPLYQEIGMNYLSPFEVASGCDVVRTGRDYPELLISGGFDKRIMAAGKEAIDREIERIMPVMYRRGGYIPTCDHGVPEEVSFENYLYYRKRMLEFAD
jgi:uroporphyrinogen decarboxylase